MVAGAGSGAAVLIPVKAFDRAKLRLSPALTPAERHRLARAMAARVVASAAGLAVAVVCDDEEVASWADGAGAAVVWAPGRGLNGAVQFGVEVLRRRGFSTVVVAASDLPLATDLSWVAAFGGITLVPDRRGQGTNVIGLPAAAPFSFSYGPGSFQRHLAHGRSLGYPVRVVGCASQAWDVDLPEDLLAV